jgi:acetoin utilization deacetylase AcuC-like enzyme
MLTLTSLLEPAARSRAFSNQPEARRALILAELEGAGLPVQRVETSAPSGLDAASELGVVSADLLDLLRRAHAYWDADSESDPEFTSDETEQGDGLVPFFSTRTRPARDDHLYQRLAWHATDASTPLYPDTLSIVEADAAVVCRAAALATEHQHSKNNPSLYLLTTMPGHHAAADRFGGYCFICWAALLVRLLERAGRTPFVVDVDYHAGDGSAEILGPAQMVSLHCAEDYPYGRVDAPWGIALPKQATWSEYEPCLREALARRPSGCGAYSTNLSYYSGLLMVILSNIIMPVRYSTDLLSNQRLSLPCATRHATPRHHAALPTPGSSARPRFLAGDHALADTTWRSHLIHCECHCWLRTMAQTCWLYRWVWTQWLAIQTHVQGTDSRSPSLTTPGWDR